MKSLNVKNTLLSLSLGLSLVYFSSACSSASSDEENLEANNSEEVNNTQGDLAEGENSDSANEAVTGAESNSDTSDDPELAENPAGEEGMPEDNMAVDQAAADVAATNNGGEVPANNMGLIGNTQEAAAANAPANMPMADAAPVAEAAPAPTGDMAPISGGRVRYVPQGGVQVLNGPNGQIVTTLNQGDHPVTWEENGWLKLGSGMYVPVGSLSDKGVGRHNKGAHAPWNGSGSYSH